MRNEFPMAFVAFAIAWMMNSGPAHGQADMRDPKSCRTIWSEIGLPTHKSRAGNQITTICHLGYITGHNNGNKTPDWVIEHLTQDIVKGASDREGLDFHPDPELQKANLPTAVPGDYDRSGFDIGHNAPAADFGKQNMLEDTFFFSNAVPQIGIGFNRSIWRTLETRVRNLTSDSRPSLYVITGPINQGRSPIKISRSSDACQLNLQLATPDKESICPDNRTNTNAKCQAGVAVPAGMFKIVYDAQSQSAFAVVFENLNHTGKYKSGRGDDYIQAHAVGINTLEDLTGYSFFAALPARKQTQIKSNCTSVKMH